MKLSPAQKAVLASLFSGLAPNHHIGQNDYGRQAAFGRTMKILRRLGLVDEMDQLMPLGYEEAKSLEHKP